MCFVHPRITTFRTTGEPVNTPDKNFDDFPVEERMDGKRRVEGHLKSFTLLSSFPVPRGVGVSVVANVYGRVTLGSAGKCGGSSLSQKCRICTGTVSAGRPLFRTGVKGQESVETRGRHC